MSLLTVQNPNALPTPPLAATRWPLTAITPYARKAKQHNIPRIMASLRQFGVDQPIVVDGDGVIIKGHGRYEAAQQLGWTTFPVLQRTDLTPEEVRLARIADNTSQDGGWDVDLYQTEIDDLAALFDPGLLDAMGAISLADTPDPRPLIDFLPDADTAAQPSASGSDSAPAGLPLAILLTPEQFARWAAYKTRLGIATDTRAFLTLLDMED